MYLHFVFALIPGRIRRALAGTAQATAHARVASWDSLLHDPLMCLPIITAKWTLLKTSTRPQLRPILGREAMGNGGRGGAGVA